MKDRDDSQQLPKREPYLRQRRNTPRKGISSRVVDETQRRLGECPHRSSMSRSQQTSNPESNRPSRPAGCRRKHDLRQGPALLALVSQLARTFRRIRFLASDHGENLAFPSAWSFFRSAKRPLCQAGDSRTSSRSRKLAHTRSMTSSFSGTDIFWSGSDTWVMRAGSLETAGGQGQPRSDLAHERHRPAMPGGGAPGASATGVPLTGIRSGGWSAPFANSPSSGEGGSCARNAPVHATRVT